jgi:hypothetical protein
MAQELSDPLFGNSRNPASPRLLPQHHRAVQSPEFLTAIHKSTSLLAHDRKGLIKPSSLALAVAAASPAGGFLARLGATRGGSSGCLG